MFYNFFSLEILTFYGIFFWKNSILLFLSYFVNMKFDFIITIINMVRLCFSVFLAIKKMTNFLSIWNFIFDFIILFHHHFVHLFTMKLINNLPCLHMFDDNNNVYESFPHLICVRVSCLLCVCVCVYVDIYLNLHKDKQKWNAMKKIPHAHWQTSGVFFTWKKLLSIVFFVVVAQLLTNDYFHPFFVLIHSFVHSVFYFTVYNALRYR